MKLFDPKVNDINFSLAKSTMTELPAQGVPGLELEENREALGIYTPPGNTMVPSAGINNSSSIVRDAMREDF